MRPTSLLAALSAAGAVSAGPPRRWSTRQANETTNDINPFTGKTLFVNPSYAAKLDQTHDAFVAKGDTANAERVRKVQKVGTFVWVSRIADLVNIDAAVRAAREAQSKTGERQIVGLVLYNLPDRDCSAGESAGELKTAQDGLRRYKEEYIAPYAAKVAAADDLDFAIVLEPDSLANLVTNMEIEGCAAAAPTYREGIAHAITALQFDHVHLYIDAAHGGWLGWDPNMPKAAAVFAEVLAIATKNGTTKAKIRGFATNVSNYNAFDAVVRENYTEYSKSWDESHYCTSLSAYLEEAGLPARFIVDQGRVAMPGARKEWGEWCNVEAGFGPVPGTSNNNTVVDSLVWIKPGGESDGRCGFPNSPAAGQWHDEYVQMLVKNAHESIDSVKL
ncbi:glycoside hydrolase family 6 protein [Podospora aff. communis PSN243]|uniref:Glucanase n=1 Tax=Podospora aff. communis PSN243 TaxID=3040156 RepID=A0AAV9G6H0_9PEZI|nr:glycoside hydrolase family 6 protein [Podospora aff. communis PSN243]